MCRAVSIEYEFKLRTARLYLAPYHCTDMRGAIALAKRIDPECHRVETYAGEWADTFYVRTGDEWSVLLPKTQGGVQ
jgi:hypothetical protein